MHDLVTTLRRIAGNKPAKTPAALLVTAGQMRHIADQIEILLNRVDQPRPSLYVQPPSIDQTDVKINQFYGHCRECRHFNTCPVSSILPEEGCENWEKP